MSEDHSHKQINWRSRIVETGKIAASQVMPHPNNPRRHPDIQRRAVEASFDLLGQIAPIIINRNNGMLVDGEERVWLALSQPGDVELDVNYVDLTEEEHLEALAVYDATTLLAIYDKERTDQILREVNFDSPALQQMMAETAKTAKLYLDGAFQETPPDERYTNKIEIPIYEPSGDKPMAHELFDNTKTAELIAQIEATKGLSEHEREFLRLAAHRHTVFNYAKIADFYAHSEPEVQRLMEDSALVIIDFDRAIELGYVKLSKFIAGLIEDENAEG